MCHLTVRRIESFQLIWFSQVKDFARNFAPQVMLCSTNGSLYKTWICAAINLQECQLGGSLIPQVILCKSLSVLPGPFVPITLKCWFCSSKKSDFPLKATVVTSSVLIRMAAENMFLLVLLLCSAASFDRAEVMVAAASKHQRLPPAQGQYQPGRSSSRLQVYFCLQPKLLFWITFIIFIEHVYMYLGVFQQCLKNILSRTNEVTEWVPLLEGEIFVTCPLNTLEYNLVTAGRVTFAGHHSPVSPAAAIFRTKIVMCMFSNNRQRLVAGLW